MENLSDIKQLHHQVQQDILRILLEYNVLEPISYSLSSKVPFYFFSEDYRFYLYDLPMEVSAYINSVNRLLETGFLITVSSSDNTTVSYLKSSDYEKLSTKEREHFQLHPNKDVQTVLLDQQLLKFSFSGETRL